MKAFFDILRGVVIGLANIIPGVSGGTMMVSMGIYDTIIGCINSLFKDFKRCIKTLWPYALGMVLGILGLAKLITFLLGTYHGRCQQLQAYLDEFCFRFNRRKTGDQIFMRLARAVAASCAQLH